MKIKVKLEGETVWLMQRQMEILFDKERIAIAKHISNIFKEGELEKSNLSEFPTNCW